MVPELDLPRHHAAVRELRSPASSAPGVGCPLAGSEDDDTCRRSAGPVPFAEPYADDASVLNSGARDIRLNELAAVATPMPV